MTIPPVRVVFEADDSQIAAAVRATSNALRTVQAQAAKTTAATAGIASGTDRMSAGFRRASQALAATNVNTQAWTRGLHTLEAQQTQATQTTARLTAAVHPMAAQMAQAASGTELFARGLRNVNAQGLGFRKGIPGLDPTNDALKKQGPLALAAGSAIRRLATVYTAVKVGSFAKGVLEDAAALDELAQATGASVPTLSVLQVGAARTNLTLDDLQTTFRGLTRSVAALNNGTPETVQAFADIGLSIRDLDGLNTDQVFLKVANAIAKLPAGLDKADAATKVFGRSGAELIPLLNDISGDGFDKMTAAAQKMGVAISGDLARNANDLGDKFDDLVLTLKGLTLAVVGPLLPALTELADGLAFITRHAAAAFTALSKLPGVLNALPFGLGNLFPPSKLPDAASFGDVSGASSSTDAAPHKATQAEIQALAELREAGKTTEAQDKRIREIVAQLRGDYAKATDDVVRQAQILKQIESLTKSIKGNTKDAADARRLELALLKQQADQVVRTLALTQAKQAGAEQENQQQFDAGITNLQEFFAKRRDILLKGTSAEISALVQQQAEIKKALALPAVEGQSTADRRTEVLALEGQLADLDAQITQAQLRGGQARKELDAQEAASAADLVQRRLQYELQIQQAKGQTLAVALVGIHEEAQAFDQILRQQGVDDQLRKQRVDAFREALTLQAQAADLQQRVDDEFGSMSRDRQAIEDRVLTGKLTERQATEQVAALEKDRLPALRALADEMTRLAEQTGNPETAKQAQQLTADLNSLAASADLAAQRAARMRAAFGDALQDATRTFLTSGIDQIGQVTESIETEVDAAGHVITDELGNPLQKVTKDVFTLGDAFVELARNVAQSFREIAVDELVESLRRGIEGLGDVAIPAAPGGLTPEILAQQAAQAPDLIGATASSAQQSALVAQEQLAAGQLTAAGATLAAAGGTLTAAGGTLTAGAGATTGAAGALTGSAGALAGAAGVLSAAAAALTAAAGASAASDAVKTAAGAAAGAAFAAGGPVPGTGNRDTVRAWLTPGEYVQTTRAVDYYGADVMEAMRRLKIPREVFRGVGRYQLHLPTTGRFATGGMVAPVKSSDGTHTVVLEAPEGWNGRVMSDDDIVKVVVRKRRTINTALGRNP